MELNKIYNEDCLETMAKMPDNFVDYVICSPQYNLGHDRKHDRESKYSSSTDNLSTKDYLEFSIKVITELIRTAKYHVFYNIQMLSGNKVALFKLFGHFADSIKEIIIWDKDKGEPAIEPGVLNSVWEFVIVFSKQSPEIRKFKEVDFWGTVDNIIRDKKYINTGAKNHFAVMPLNVPRKIMLQFTKHGDIIYDPFTGTGTTLIAAIKENRQWIGSEISKEYCELAEKRIAPYLKQQTLFNYQ